MIEMPAIGTYNEVAAYLRLKRSTIYKMTHRGAFKPGIYIGQGRFNMDRLRKCIDEEGSYLKGHRP